MSVQKQELTRSHDLINAGTFLVTDRILGPACECSIVQIGHRSVFDDWGEAIVSVTRLRDKARITRIIECPVKLRWFWIRFHFAFQQYRLLFQCTVQLLSAYFAWRGNCAETNKQKNMQRLVERFYEIFSQKCRIFVWTLNTSNIVFFYLHGRKTWLALWHQFTVWIVIWCVGKIPSSFLRPLIEKYFSFNTM